MAKTSKTQKTPNTKGDAPAHRGGDQSRKAQEWAGGSKAGKAGGAKKAKPFARLDDALLI